MKPHLFPSHHLCSLLLLAFFAAWLPAAQTAGDLTGASKPPQSIASSDWSSIRAAHDAWLHGFMPLEKGGWKARNPGQR